MNKKYFYTIFGAALALGFTACSDDDDLNPGGNTQGNTPGKIEMTSSQLSTVAKCNNFGFRLLNEAVQAEELEGKNLILSPISCNFALSMLANGAANETQEGIINGLGYESLSIDEINDINQRLTNELGKLDPKVTLNLANSIWHRPEISVNKSFTSTVERNYDASVRKINDGTFIKDINNWCASKTNGKITDFMSQNAGTPDFALFNAVYFKGLWSTRCKFNRQYTRDNIFNNQNGSTSTVPFMNQMCADYGQSATMQSCRLKFGNSSFRAAFILPDKGVTISEAFENLALGEWEQLQQPCYPEIPYSYYSVNLSLPKFKIESDVMLNKILVNLGMPLFDINADYSNISESPLRISYVKQKTFFEINEDGAEAATVTGIGMATADLSQPKEIDLTFDRPFIYVVYEHSTGAILFAGCVTSFAN